MNIPLNMNNGRAIISQIKDIDTRANLCRNNFDPATIKNDNGAIEMRIVLQQKRNQQTHQLKKGGHG